MAKFKRKEVEKTLEVPEFRNPEDFIPNPKPSDLNIVSRSPTANPKIDLVKIAKEKLGAEISVPQEEEKIVGLSKFRQDMAESGRFILPYLKVVQAMSDDFTKDGIQPGLFRNSLTGEVYGHEIEIRTAGVFHWRRRFEDRNVLCSSNDAITGYGDPGGNCRSCPLQTWSVKRINGVVEEISNIRNFRQKKDEELLAPLCAEQFVFPSIVLNSSFYVPGALVFHKSYLREGLRLYQMIEYTPLDAVYKIVSDKITNSKGTWFVPRVVGLSRKLKEGEMFHIQEFMRKLRSASAVEVAGTDQDENAQ